MAWIKIKSSITKQILTVPESAYADILKTTDIYEKVEEPKPEIKQKASKPKEEKKDVEEIQLNNKDENNSSGKDKEKIGV